MKKKGSFSLINLDLHSEKDKCSQVAGFLNDYLELLKSIQKYQLTLWELGHGNIKLSIFGKLNRLN